MIRVHLDGLVKRYDRVAVVDGATLELAAGELTVVLGPSGAGKTTLARLIAGLERPEAGEIFFDARVVGTLPPQDRRVGMVFQEDALWPRLTVAENVGYALKLARLPRPERRERVAEALNALRIDTLAAKRPDDLSGLQRQRVALSRALAVRPELLILDEPLGLLEHRVRDEFRDDLRRIHAETGLTTLALTHDSREALALADKLAVMDLGKIAQVGTPAEVYNGPADAFVARLLSRTNLVQGQVEGAGARGEVIVRTPFGRLIGRGLSPEPPLGTPVTVSIRPESLALGTAVPPGSNRFHATIERLVFLGETREVHLRAPGDWPVFALALRSQTQGLRQGQSVTLSVPPDQVVVLLGKYAMPRS
ncbi:MAG: ABC transporter ATP-binding protein [Isosphaeraceae bacterium]